MEGEIHGELAFLDTLLKWNKGKISGLVYSDRNEIVKRCWEEDHILSWDQKKVVDRES